MPQVIHCSHWQMDRSSGCRTHRLGIRKEVCKEPRSYIIQSDGGLYRRNRHYILPVAEPPPQVDAADSECQAVEPDISPSSLQMLQTSRPSQVILQHFPSEQQRPAAWYPAKVTHTLTHHMWHGQVEFVSQTQGMDNEFWVLKAHRPVSVFWRETEKHIGLLCVTVRVRGQRKGETVFVVKGLFKKKKKIRKSFANIVL